MSWPAVKRAMRDYLRANTGVQSAIGNRVFFAVPARVKYPLVVVSRIGGGQDIGIAPFDRPLLDIHIWGNFGDEDELAPVVSAVRDALDAIQSGTALNASVIAFGASVIGAVELQDPDDGRPFVALTVDVTARAVPVP